MAHKPQSLRKVIGCFLLLTGLLFCGVMAQSAGIQEPPLASKAEGSPEFRQIAHEAAQAREANRMDKAVELYERGLKLNPRWSEGWWYLGTFYYDGDRYSEGLAAFHNLVQFSPEYGPGWAMLGLCEFEMHDYKNSYIHIQLGRVKGLENNQDLIHVAKYHQALIDLLGGDFEDANSLLSSLVLQNILSNDVKVALGLALLHVPLLPNQVDPSRSALISAAGNVGELEALNEFDQAKKDHEQLIHDYPTTPFVHYSYGAMLAQLSQYNEAEKELLEEIKVNPDSSMPYMQLAYIYIRVSRFDDALRLARKSVQLVPHSFAAHYLVGRALLETGNVNESIQELTAAKKLGPYSPEVHYNLSRALARAKRTQEAAKEQAEFERLNALVERSKEKSQPQTYNSSGDRGVVVPHEGQRPPDNGPPQ
jgi:predicted Zn-dependent protease